MTGSGFCQEPFRRLRVMIASVGISAEQGSLRWAHVARPSRKRGAATAAERCALVSAQSAQYYRADPLPW